MSGSTMMVPSEPWTAAKLNRYVGDCNGIHHFDPKHGGHRADEIPNSDRGQRFLVRLEEYFDSRYARVMAKQELNRTV